VSTPVHDAIAALPVPGEWTWQVVVRPRRRTLGIEVDEAGDVLFAVPDQRGLEEMLAGFEPAATAVPTAT